MLSAWLAKTSSRIILVVVAVALVAAMFGLWSWQRQRGAKTEAKVAKGQSGAAMQSGADAVDTIGNAQARETSIDRTVKDGSDAIDAAPAGDSNDAALRAACGMRSYRDQPACAALHRTVAE